MTAQTSQVINTIRGKNVVGGATQDDISLLIEHIDALEDLLDGTDGDDVFVTAGWRDYLGIDDG